MNKKTKAEAGRLGAYARMRLHGNPGTLEGRKKGGLASLATHAKRKTGFLLRKKISLPRPSLALAEFIGIMLGDGHVGQYQASVTTNTQTDMEHATYVQKSIKNIFHITSSLQNRKNKNACAVVISSRSVCEFLKTQGLPFGNKVKDGVSIPQWIRNNQRYRFMCARGLFDTDGSVYEDKHVIKGKTYQSVALAFTNRNEDILSFFKDTLLELNLHPTQKTKYTVFLRRMRDIDIFFLKIGTSNLKHLKRYNTFKK